MKAGYTLLLSWFSTNRLLTISLLSALFLSLFSNPLEASSLPSDEAPVLPKGETTCADGDSSLEDFSPPNYFISPAEGKRVDLYYRGLKRLLPARVDIPNVETVEKVYIEVVYKGTLPDVSLHAAIQARLENGSEVTLTPKLIKGNWGSSGVGIFYAEVGKTNRVQLDFEVQETSAQSVMLYVLRNEQIPGIYQAGTYANFYGNRETVEFNLPVPRDPRRKDIRVTIPITEITTDGRQLDFEITAGSVVKRFTRRWDSGFNFDNQCCIDSVETILKGIGEIDNINIKVTSPENNGQSFVLSGIVQAELCPVCDPLVVDLPRDICTDNTVVLSSESPGPGYEAIWDFGPGAHPRTHTGFGEVFIMFSEPRTNQEVTVKVTSATCVSTETYVLEVKECSASSCALEEAVVVQNPANGNDNGIIELDMCVSCGSTPPYRVFYTYQGQEFEKGPFNESRPTLRNLAAGTYSKIYVIDANGCQTNITGPVTLCNGGCGNMPVCEELVCTLSGFNDRNRKRSIWLPNIGFTDPRWRWEEGTGNFIITGTNTAKIEGRIVSIEDPTCGFEVHMVFANRRNWTQWSALGRGWKGNRYRIKDNQHTTWDYYEMVASESTLKGFGCWTGTLNLEPRPADYTYGLQVGEGANDQNLSPGLSAWFAYSGALNGISISGEGDINDEGTCRLTDMRRNAVPIISCAPDFAVSCGGSPDDAPAPTINCGNPEDYTLTFEDREVSANPRRIERTWTVVGPGGPATCTQTLTFGDENPPIFTSLPTQDSMLCGEIVAQQAEATDDCGAATVTFRETKFNETCPGNYDLRRVWTATDESGNTATAELIVHVIDKAGPVFQSKPLSIVIDCTDDLPTDQPVAVDACGGNVTIDYSVTDCLAKNPVYTWAGDKLTYLTEGVDPNYSYSNMTPLVLEAVCSDNPSQRLRWRVTNKNTFPVWLNKVEAYGRDIYSSGFSVPAQADIFFFTPTEAGDKTVSITWRNANQQSISETASPGTEQCELTKGETVPCAVERKWKATDECGNFTWHVQDVWIRDTEAPVLRSLPADRTYSSAASVPAPANVTATDECGTATVQFFEEKIESNAYACDDAAVHYLFGWESVQYPILTLDGEQFIIGNEPLRLQENCGGTALLTGTLISVIDPNATFDINLNLKNRRTYAEHNAAGGTSQTDCTSADKTDWKFYQFETNSSFVGAGTKTGETLTISSNNWLQLGAGANQNNCKLGIQTDFVYLATSSGSNPRTGSIRGAISSVHLEEAEACADSYTLIRTWIATDESGNRAVERQVIRVVDAEKPTFEGVPNNVTIDCSDAIPIANVSAIDNADSDVEISLDETDTGDSCGRIITRTWTAIDDCGNSNTARQVITVRDQSPPVITFNNPEIQALNSGDILVISCSDIPTIDESIASVTDNCDPAPSLTFRDEPLGDGDCRSDGFQTRFRCTWTATDQCGNETVFFLFVELRDDLAPTFAQVPSNTSQSCDATLPTDQPTATDNCSSDPVIVETQSTIPGACADSYQIVRLWTATDDCGNTATASQVITVSDETAPVFTNVPQNVTLNCEDALPTNEPTVSDNCDQNVRLVETQETQAGSCASSYVLIRMWTATDNCGKSATVSQVVTVQDNENPTLTFSNARLAGLSDGDELVVDCDDIPVFGETDVIANDNCDINVNIGFSETLVADGNCETDGYLKLLNYAWTAVDACGNSARISINLKVQDVSAPSITSVPGNISISCEQAMPTSQPTVSDNCTSNAELTVTETSTTEAGDCTERYKVIRLWTVTDACGNVATASQVVSVNDEIRPILAQVPESITVSCDEPFPTTLPTATDNCDTDVAITVEENRTDADCPGNASVVRIFTATDNCGNTATASQVVTIRDRQAPVFTDVPQAETLSCTDAVPTSQPSVTDNCDANVSVVETTERIEGACPDNYTLIRTWTATDECGLTATASQAVTFQDNEVPVLVSLPQNTTIRCDEQLPTDRPSATDNCDTDVNIAETQQTRPGDCENSYEVVRLFTATDNCGNVATASQVVTITDDIKPTFSSVPANVTIDCNGTIPQEQPSATDNCDGQVAVIETQETQPGNCPGSYTLIRLFTATDKCGNVGTASQIVTVKDDLAPVFAYVPANLAISCSMALPTEEAEASDNCDQAVVITETQQTRPGNCAGTYDVVRLFTATDHCGNATTASQVVSISDDEAPTFAGTPANVSISCDASVPTSAPTASDNCDSDVDVQLTETREDGPCTDSYRIIRRWVATDHCGNVATASQVVTVQDQTIPLFASVPQGMTISCSQSLPTSQPTATDNCDSEVNIAETQRVETGDCTDSYKVIRVWTATDNCGNVATASQTIQVEDREAPRFADVPTSVSIGCDDALPSIGPNVTDNCDDEVSLNETQETRPGDCPQSYDIIRTWTATDNCGNVSTASQVVTVSDSEAPIFAFVPATVTIDCDASLPASQPEVDDNCDLTVQVTERQETQAGNCGGAYTVIRIWTAVDNCGNESTASQTVNVQDISAPTFASVPQATTIQCDDALPVTQPIVTDNCDDNVSVTEAQNTEAGNCAGNYTVVRVWTAIDNCGNTTTAEQRVTVTDTEAPVFTQVPASITLSCEDDVPTVLAEARDNCATNVTVTETQDRVEGNCPGNFTITRIFTATDDCGNASTASQVIVFQDNTDPSFANIPTTVTIECDGVLPTDVPTATDNCDQNVSIVETQENQPGTCEDNYRVIRIWTATDNCGNASTASQIVNVVDTQAPTFASVPTEVTIECSDPLPTDMASATDNCDTEVTVSVIERNEPGNCLDSYTVIRVFTATDNCGNSATAEQRVNVVDTQAPTFVSVPQAVTISCDEAVPATPATATDNCDTQVTVTETERIVAGDCTDRYEVIRLFTATDNCGNTATAEQIITIQDGQAPTFANIPQAVTIGCDEALPTSAPVASDNCDTQVTVTEAQRTEPGDCAESSFVIRTWTAVDNCGNTATAEQRVTLIDEVAPVFVSVPVGVTIACDQPLPTDLPVATDNCDDEVTITETQETVPGDCAGAYDVIRTFTATDGCGNTATASQTVKVEDKRNPVFANVPVAITISCDEQLPTDQPTATDTCDDNVDIEESEEFLAGSCGGSYRVIRQWTATDDCGNTVTATQLVTVQDNVAPVFVNVPPAVALSCDDVIPTALPDATDNCDDDVHISETQQRMPGGCGDSYTLVRTFTATDECGNFATASQVVTVDDSASPVFANVPTDREISCDEELPTELPTATDSCDDDVNVTEAQQTIPGDCPGAYQVIRTWTAVDNCGNTATASQTISVGDRAEPTFANVPAGVTIECDDEVPNEQPVAIDNCDNNVIITEVQTTETGDCTDSYRIIRTWTAADDCGNLATVSQVVRVEDNTAPEFVSVPPAVTISCDQDLPTTQPRAVDNCAAEVTITERTDRDRGNCADNSTITRIWTATDNCGNSTTATQLVTIQDNTPPVFANVPSSVTILCDESAPDSEPTATDNCDDEVRIRSSEERIEGNCKDSYQLVRTWTAEDDCGNVATASQVVTVIDPTAPTFAQVPPETTISCNESMPTSQPVANDNCDTDVTITETQETLPGDCPDSYEVIRTWVITDNCGNSDRATQKVTVIDMSEPTFARVPASRTVNCDEDPGDEEPVVSDNCDDDVAITMTETTNGDNCAEGIELIRIWTATDNCGNTATASQTITFVDNQDPVIAGLERSITVECDQPVPLIYPTATDNCDRDVDIMYFDNEQNENCGRTITRTWVASDDCGNTSSEVQLIVIRDSQVPVLSGVPASAQINCDDAIPTANVTATDNCSTDVLVTLEEFEIPGGCPGERSITRIWTATDDCGNAATGSQVISISDGGAPVFDLIPAAVSISCTDNLPTALPTATDNCGGGAAAVDVTVEESNEPGNCANNYRVIRLFTATDDCGNTATASQVVTITDSEAPTFATVPESITLSCSDELPSGMATATDNCDNNVNVTMSERTIAGNCDDSYEIIRTFTAIDACGMSATASQTITVLDSEAPIFSDVPLNAEVSCDDPIPSGTPTATDDCDEDVDVSVEEERIVGATSNEYELVRTWTAMDNCGNTATVSQVITVIADGQPAFTFVPEDLTLSCTQEIPSADARAVDNCDGDLQVVLTEVEVEGNCTNNYQVIRTWTATDADGNSATASQTITVSDNVAPSFDQVPANVTLVCGALVPTDMATASDACDANVVVTVTETNRPGNCGSEFDVLRTFRATDDCGNASTATQVVSFIDDQAPEFTFVPDSEEFQCNVGQPRERAQATDNCTSNVQITFEDVSPSSDCSQRLQRIWTATDECGNASTAVQQILLDDTEDPVLQNVPGNAAIDLTNGGTIPAPANVTASDNCDANPSVEYTQTTQPTTGCGYILVRTWEATDQCGNSKRATQRITVTEDAGVSISVDPNTDCAPTGIQLHAVPASPGAIYAWTSSGGSFLNGNTANPTFIPAGAGMYTINLSVSGSGCSGTATETINIDGATLNVSSNGPVCAGNTIELTASGGADSYSWSGPNGFSASQANVSIPNATPAMGGTYTLTADFGSCTQDASVSVNVGGSLQIQLDIPSLICSGQSVSFTATGADNATWTSPGGQTLTGNTVQINAINFGDHNGQWTVVGSNATGCASTQTFEVIVERNAQVIASSNSPICEGGQIELSAAGGQNYRWTGPNGFASNLASPIITDLSNYPAGTYQFIAELTNSLGCTSLDTAVVVIAGAGSISASVPNSVCEGETLRFSASGANSYVWSGPNNFTSLQASPSITAITAVGAGTYTLNAETAAGCATTQTFEVVVRTDCDPNGCNLPEQSDFTLIQPTCGQSDGSITFTGDTTGYVFTWTNNAGSGGQASSLPAAGYWLTVMKRGVSACAKTYDFLLEEDGAPEVTLDVEGMQCTSDGAITITPSPAGSYTVLWSDQTTSTTSLVRNDLSAGDYTFTLTSANGCAITQTVNVPDECECSARISVIRAREIDVCLVGDEATIGVVLVTPPVIPANFGRSYLLAEVGTNQVVRTNKTGEFVVNGSKSFSIHQLVYDSVNVANSLIGPGKTVQEIEALFLQGGGQFCGALTTFGARITTAQCCIIPEVTSTSTTDASCGQQNGTANVQVAGNVTDFVYNWTPNLGSPLNAAGNVRGGLPAGAYRVRIENRADATCFAEATVNVGASDIDAGLPSITPATCGDDNGVVVFGNAAPGLTFTWSDNVVRSSRDDLAAGVYTVTVSNGQPNCSETISITVGAVADFGLTASINNTPACGASDGSVTINASGGSGNFSYDWGAGNTRTDLEAGLYTVRVTDQVSNCVDSVTFTLTELAAGQVQITISDVELRCNGAMDGTPVFSLDYDTNFKFPPRISFVDSQGDEVTFGELGPGSYCMQVRDADDCLAGTGCFQVTQPSGLLVNVTAIAATCDDGGSISLDISGGTPPYNYDWAHLPSQNDPRDLTDLAEGQYTIFITDANGCASTVNNINIGRNCGCTPTLPVLSPFPGNVCLTDAQVQLGTQVVSASTDPGIETAYLLVDADGLIVQTASTPEFWVSAIGNYTIHGIVYDPFAYSLNTITLGSTSLNSLNTQFIQGGGFLCVGLDLTGTAVVVDDCSGCTAEVGTLSTASPVIWCTDDGLPSVVVFDLTASSGTVTYVLVDSDGTVLTISSFNEIDFENQAAGTYTVYAVATEGVTNLPLPGSPLFPTSGCIDVSQGIEVTALTGSDCSDPCQVAAGSISTVTPSTLCIRDLPASVNVSATGQTGSQRAYVLTNMGGTILSVQAADGTLDIANVSAGQYLAHVLVYENPITGLDVGRTLVNLSGCFALTSPSTITVSAGSACGQSPVSDTVQAVVPVNTLDTICFVLDPGFNPATTTYMLVGGTGTTGQSSFGQWTLLPNGCIQYEAGNTPGVDVDFITVIATDGGQTDTTVFIITVAGASNTTETVNVSVQTNESNTTCPSNIPSVFTSPGAVLSTGGLTGSTAFGSYSVDALTGCLTYSANELSGAFIDTVVVFVCDADLLVCHEVTYIISVLPEGQSIVRDVTQGDTLLLCPPTSLLFGTPQTPTLCTQPSQGSATFDAATGCFIYTSPADYVGSDELCIEVCDDQGICVQLVVQINVLPGCGDLILETIVGLNTSDCDGLADYCLPIANSNIGNFALVLDGQPYRNTSVACNNGLGTVINVDTGTHVLIINEIATGCSDTVEVNVGCQDCGFNTTPAVIDVSSCDDTAVIELSLLEGNWDLYQFTLDGSDARNELIANGTGTQLVVDTGLHQLIIKAIDNSCLEVIDVNVRCDDGINPTGDTTIVRTIQLSFSDTICLDALNLDITGAVITLTDLCPDAGDGGEAMIDFNAATQCFVYTGILAGRDTLCLQACTEIGCDTFGLVVIVTPPTVSNVDVTVAVGEAATFCIDTTELAPPIVDVFNICPDSSGTAVSFTIDPATYCVTYEGLATGTEQGCFVICNDIICDTVYLNVTSIIENANLPPVAVNDRDMTTKNTPVEINILANDTLNGQLVQLYPLTLPANGNLFIVGDSIIRYTPDAEFCGGVDSFQYVISNGIGFDTASVRIDVACDDLIVFSGFSPNGDGRNDFLKILGIEDYPTNKVLIFNRWGNEVFNIEGYDNTEQKSFRGQFGEKTLPDGTYFYVIDLGDGTGCRSGYVQISR